MCRNSRRANAFASASEPSITPRSFGSTASALASIPAGKRPFRSILPMPLPAARNTGSSCVPRMIRTMPNNHAANRIGALNRTASGTSAPPASGRRFGSRSPRSSASNRCAGDSIPIAGWSNTRWRFPARRSREVKLRSPSSMAIARCRRSGSGQWAGK